jgi:hypothetical protein
MLGTTDAVAGIVKGVGGILDDLFTSDEEREAAKLKLAKLEMEGKLENFKTQLSAILAEAKSNDPWTSRARPTFLYVVYVFILAAIPMGILSAFKPELAIAIAAGARAWLNAIPGELYALFGAGYLGYSHMRSGDKKMLQTQLKKLGS